MKKIFFKPFENYSEQKLLAVGIISFLITSILANFLNCRFDGVFDMHIVADAKFYQIIIDNSINVTTVSFFLFFISYIINKKTRLIDIINTSLVSRTPYIILPFFNINNTIGRISESILENLKPNSIPELSTSDIALLTLFSLVSIITLVWHIVLLYSGFKVSSNSKNSIHIIYFIIVLILAEIISKYLIITLN